MDQLPRLGKRELICLLLFTCNYVVFVWRGFLFLWVLGMGYVILLRHSLSLPYNYFGFNRALESMVMKKVKIKIKIYFTPRPMEPEFYNVLVYMYRFNKIMDRTDFSDQFQKITMSQI